MNNRIFNHHKVRFLLLFLLFIGTLLALCMAPLASAPSCYSAHIALKKYTEGEEAAIVPGPHIPVGSNITWTYQVTNTGTVPLKDIVLNDYQEGPAVCPKTILAPDEMMNCTLTGTAKPGQYTNRACVQGIASMEPQGPSILISAPEKAATTVYACDVSHYLGTENISALSVQKYISVDRGQTWIDVADTADPNLPVVVAGSPVSWKYVIVNSGAFLLQNVTIADTPEVTLTCTDREGKEINPCKGKGKKISLQKFEPGDTITCYAEGSAVEICPFVNSVTVTGEDGNAVVSGKDESYYCGYNPATLEVCKREVRSETDEVPYPGGWIVNLTGPRGYGMTQETDGEGCTVFASLVPGVYTLTEGPKEGWVNVSPSSVNGIMLPGEKAQHIFYNIRESTWGTLQVCKYNLSEPFIGGWNITVNGPFGYASTQTTDGTGCTVFSHLAPGNYTVTEDSQEGWVNLTPERVQMEVQAGAQAAAAFTNAPSGMVTDLEVCKFNLSEPFTGGWNITVNGPYNNETHATDGSGCASFGRLVTGAVYQVQEEEKDGWLNLTPRSMQVIAGEVKELRFVNGPRNAIANLALTKEVTPMNAHIGDEVTWTVTVKNNGPGDARQVRIQENTSGLGDGVRIDSMVLSRGSYGNGVWTLDRIDAGEEETLTLTTVFPSPGTYWNNVSAEEESFDPLFTDNIANTSVIISPAPACMEGEVHCVEGTYYECVDGFFRPNASLNDQCGAPLCEEGSSTCAGELRYDCINGYWVRNPQDDDQCFTPECENGEDRCIGQEYYFCEGGHWVNNPFDARCVFSSECDEGEHLCKENQYFACVEGIFIHNASLDGQCISPPECVEGSWKCAEGQYFECTGGSYQPNPSFDGLCILLTCNDGDTKCENGRAYDCILGEWMRHPSDDYLCPCVGDTGICSGSQYFECIDGSYVRNESKDVPFCAECRGQDTKCDTGLFYECMNGSWQRSPSGDISCPCAEGEWKCQDHQYYECTDGVYVHNESMDIPTCAACVELETRCEDGLAYTCLEGEWQRVPPHDQYCPSPPPGCEGGETTCEGTWYFVCSGGVFVHHAALDYLCTTPPECSEGEYGCIDGKYWECVNGSTQYLPEFDNQCTLPPATATLTSCKQDENGGNLSGWTMILGDPQGAFTENVTDNTGCTLFRVTESGTYYLSEQMQPGWQPLDLHTDSLVPIPITVNQVGSDIHYTFHNRGILLSLPYATITACKEENLTKAGLNQWVMTISNGSSSWSQTTGTQGCTVFSVGAPGQWVVNETLQEGWINITPASSIVDVTLPAEGVNVYGPIIFSNNRLNVNASLEAWAYYDTNADGQKESDDPAISGVRVTLSLSPSPMIRSTDNTGMAMFDNLAPGTYQVDLEIPDGYYLTSGNAPFSLSLTEGTHAEVEFGLHLISSPGPVSPGGGGFYGGGMRECDFIQTGKIPSTLSGYVVDTVTICAVDGIGKLVVSQGVTARTGGGPLTEASITPLYSRYPEGGSGLSSLGHSYDLTPHGTTLRPPIRLTLEFEPKEWAVLEGKDLALRIWNNDSARWDEVPMTISTTDRMISGNLSRLGIIGLFEQVPVPPTPEPKVTLSQSTITESPVFDFIPYLLAALALLLAIAVARGWQKGQGKRVPPAPGPAPGEYIRVPPPVAASESAFSTIIGVLNDIDGQLENLEAVVQRGSGALSPQAAEAFVDSFFYITQVAEEHMKNPNIRRHLTPEQIEQLNAQLQTAVQKMITLSHQSENLRKAVQARYGTAALGT